MGGKSKQQKKKIDIYEVLKEEGFDIGYSTTCNTMNLPRFTGQQDKTITNLMEVQETWKERKDNLLRNLRKRQ